MRRFPDLLVGFLFGFAVLLTIFFLSSDFSAHYQICKEGHADAKECASYNAISYVLFKLWAALDALNGAITAIATAFIAWFTLSLRQATDRLSQDSTRSAIEQRRIGEAQVRAYVSIKEARIDFHSAYAHPIVGFVATNSGQSPARNFVWNIDIQYVGEGINRTVSFNRKWLEGRGLDIPAGKDADQERAHIADMSAKSFVQSVSPNAQSCLVRVRIDFRYTDVFDQDWFGETYLAAVMAKIAESSDTSSFGEQSHWRAGNLTEMPKPKDWEG